MQTYVPSLIGLTVLLLILTQLLSGCASAPAGVAPRLSNPPASVVDALDRAAWADPSAASWVIALDRFYQKQDAVAQ